MILKQGSATSGRAAKKRRSKLIACKEQATTTTTKDEENRSKEKKLIKFQKQATTTTKFTQSHENQPLFSFTHRFFSNDNMKKSNTICANDASTKKERQTSHERNFVEEEEGKLCKIDKLCTNDRSNFFLRQQQTTTKIRDNDEQIEEKEAEKKDEKEQKMTTTKTATISFSSSSKPELRPIKSSMKLIHLFILIIIFSFTRGK